MVGVEAALQFCVDRAEPHFVRQSLSERNNLMGFKNSGGLFKSRVCWWHSLFQRNSAYLALFLPNLPAPSDKEAVELIRDLRRGDRVVVIGGFSHLSDFSTHYRDLIQQELEAWQIEDTFINQKWINGVLSPSTTDPDRLEMMMNELYHYVMDQGHVAFQVRQEPGLIGAHSWLVVGMEKQKRVIS